MEEELEVFGNKIITKNGDYYGILNVGKAFIMLDVVFAHQIVLMGRQILEFLVQNQHMEEELELLYNVVQTKIRVEHYAIQNAEMVMEQLVLSVGRHAQMECMNAECSVLLMVHNVQNSLRIVLKIVQFWLLN